MTRTVLLMVHEFPPAGGGGVQRMAKFARYLPESGWTPVVLTSAPGRGRPIDESLLAEVQDVTALRLPQRRVSTLFATALAPLKRVRSSPNVNASASAGAATGTSTSTSASAAAGTTTAPGANTNAARSLPPLSTRLARCISMDDASWWAISAARAGVAFGRAHNVQAVVASGPPFSVTGAGMRLARRLQVPLVVDMRDGWRDNPVAWFPSARGRRRALAAERAVMAQADLVLATTEVIAGEARELGARDVRVLPNGYDATDLANHKPDPHGPLRLTFMGKIYRNLTEPWNLFAALAQARELRPDLDIRLDVIGDASNEVRGVASESRLADKIDFTGYLPHREALERVAQADVAVALIADRPGAKGPIAGKMFEYLAIGLPTLALAPVDGEAARLVTALSAGWVVAPHDVAAITARIIDLAESKRRGSLGVTIDPAAVARYDRRALSAELASALNEVTSK